MFVLKNTGVSGKQSGISNPLASIGFISKYLIVQEQSQGFTAKVRAA
jgi:hypothetical protein